MNRSKGIQHMPLHLHTMTFDPSKKLCNFVTLLALASSMRRFKVLSRFGDMSNANTLLSTA